MTRPHIEFDKRALDAVALGLRQKAGAMFSDGPHPLFKDRLALGVRIAAQEVERLADCVCNGCAIVRTGTNQTCTNCPRDVAPAPRVPEGRG